MSDAHAPAHRAPIIVATVIFLFFSGFASLGYFTTEQLGNDFSVYWRVANGTLDQAYDWSPKTYGFPYAPTMLPWIQPLALVPRTPAFIAFDLISIAAFVLAVRRYLPPLAILLCLISPALFSGLLTGQVSLLLTAVLITACATPNRVVAGVLFGLVASIKPQLVIMAPLFFLVTRDWRAFWAAAATFAGLLLLSLLLFGIDIWRDWVASLPAFREAIAGSNLIKKGVTPGIVVERFGGPREVGMLVGAAVGVALIVAGHRKTAIEQAALIGTASLLAAPYALPYDLAVFMPLIALALLRGDVLAVVAAFPIQPLPLLMSCRELIRRPNPPA